VTLVTHWQIAKDVTYPSSESDVNSRKKCYRFNCRKPWKFWDS